MSRWKDSTLSKYARDCGCALEVQSRRTLWWLCMLRMRHRFCSAPRVAVNGTSRAWRRNREAHTERCRGKEVQTR
eukprot:18885-Eustigmatos_ZCMA.PRE.1